MWTYVSVCPRHRYRRLVVGGGFICIGPIDEYFVLEDPRVVTEGPSLGLRVGARTADLLR